MTDNNGGCGEGEPQAVGTVAPWTGKGGCSGGRAAGSCGSGTRRGALLSGPWQAVHDVARLRAQLALSLREQHAARDKLVAAQQVRACGREHV